MKRLKTEIYKIVKSSQQENELTTICKGKEGKVTMLIEDWIRLVRGKEQDAFHRRT